jgi:hypothetical protein
MCNVVLPFLSATLSSAGSAARSTSTRSRRVPLAAMSSAVWPFLSVRSAMLGSASSSARTTSTCPFRAAECTAVLPLLRAISARLTSTCSNLTTSMCPCVAAAFSAVVFDASTVIDSSSSTFTTSARHVM